MTTTKEICPRCNGTELQELRFRITSTAGPEYLDQTVCVDCAAYARKIDPKQLHLKITAIGLPESAR